MTNIPTHITGRYFLPGRAQSIDAVLSDGGALLVVTPEGKEDPIEVEFDRLSDRLANVPRKIYFKDGSFFETMDNGAVDLAFGKTKQFFTRLSAFESSWKIVTVATVLTVGALFGLYRYGIPAAANLAAKATPTAITDAIDAGALETVDRVFFEESKLDEARQAELTLLFQEIVDASGKSTTEVDLLFRDGVRLGANAIALPGGTIILTDQLEALVEDDDEIAGVFAHEIGHVAEHHSLRQIYRVLGLTFLISFVGGDSGQIVEEVLGQAVLLESFSHTRAYEEDADDFSVGVMTKLGRDPFAFVDLLDRVVEKYGGDPEAETNWLDTHPGNHDRRKNVQEEIDRISK